MSKSKTKEITIPLRDLWIKQQFDKLHAEHKNLHEEHKEILKRLDVVPSFVTPELEAQILRAAKTAKLIDSKVPDVPPPVTPTK